MGDREQLNAGIEPASLPVVVSTRRPVFQWSREWPPRGLAWEPWQGEESPDPAAEGDDSGDGD